MYEKLLAVFALILFGGFLAILVWWVEAIALQVVLLITFLFAAYDFWLDAFSSKKTRNGSGKGH